MTCLTPCFASEMLVAAAFLGSCNLSVRALGSRCRYTSLYPPGPSSSPVPYVAALSELWWWCFIDVGPEREASLCSSKSDEQQSRFASLDILSLGREGILVLGVPGGKELQWWSFGIDKWFSHFTAISPIVIFIFCLGGLQLPYLFILLFAFRASLCLFSTISLFSFFSPSDFICNLHFNLAW